jgi:mono/diheme cytochrome c family protein
LHGFQSRTANFLRFSAYDVVMRKATLLLLAALAGAGAYFVLRSPKQNPAKQLRIDATPEMLARGEHLFEITDCAGCHSERDLSLWCAPEVPGRRVVGAALPPEFGLPGKVVAPNITPDQETGIGDWTDGEIVRAIREGVDRNGRALFPMMPYPQYRSMSDEDVYALVAYLRTLPPVRNSLPETKLNFPASLLIKSVPAPLDGPVPPPDTSDPGRYGEYLVTIAGCLECHTQERNGKLETEKLLAGGRDFSVGSYSVRSANITPEMETGIGAWSEDRFVEKFRGYARMTPESTPKVSQESFTLMPWLNFTRLTDAELHAIYSFLRTVKPVRNAVDPHKPVTQS